MPVGKDSFATTDMASTGLVINVQPAIAAQQFNTPSNCYQAVSSINLPRRENLMMPSDMHYFHAQRADSCYSGEVTAIAMGRQRKHMDSDEQSLLSGNPVPANSSGTNMGANQS
jgi:hypothetical protein